ncbi:MAG: Rab family GTPase [Methanobacteriota archaeon]
MAETREFKSKVCLVGDMAVGKTSLLRRFVLNMFDDHYISTVGTKVSKKEVEVSPAGETARFRIEMAIWDIMGQPHMRQLLEDAYFNGARAVLAVVDITRRATFEGLRHWVDSVGRVAGEVPWVLAVTKVDLMWAAQVRLEEIRQYADAYGFDYYLTSARTGENVENAFHRLGRQIVERRRAASVAAT